MSDRLKPRAVIRSLNDIPYFESEEDEREWWARHELSASIWREQLDWTALPFLLPLDLRAIEAPQVEWLLDSAKRHTDAALRVRAVAVGRETSSHRNRVEHALAALMFAASAVEAGMNLRLLSPHFWFSEDARHAELGDYPAEVNLPWRWKLEQAASAFAAPAEPNLIETIAALCSRRDQLLQAIPPLGEPGPDDLYRSRVYYDAAHDFLSLLRLESSAELKTER